MVHIRENNIILRKGIEGREIVMFSINDFISGKEKKERCYGGTADRNW